MPVIDIGQHLLNKGDSLRIHKPNLCKRLNLENYNSHSKKVKIQYLKKIEDNLEYNVSRRKQQILDSEFSKKTEKLLDFALEGHNIDLT